MEKGNTTMEEAIISMDWKISRDSSSGNGPQKEEFGGENCHYKSMSTRGDTTIDPKVTR
jgi:hypothetical protein